MERQIHRLVYRYGEDQIPSGSCGSAMVLYTHIPEAVAVQWFYTHTLTLRNTRFCYFQTEKVKRFPDYPPCGDPKAMAQRLFHLFR